MTKSTKFTLEERLQIYEEALKQWDSKIDLDLTRYGLCYTISEVSCILFNMYISYLSINKSFPELKLNRRLRGKGILDKHGVKPKRIKILKEAIRLTKLKLDEKNSTTR